MPRGYREPLFSAASKRPTKKRKTTVEFDPTQPTVEILLENGDTTQNYSVHEDLLRAKSKYFDEHLQAPEERKPVLVKDVEQEVFDIFIKWVYSGKLAALKPSEARSLTSDSETDESEPSQATGEVESTPAGATPSQTTNGHRQSGSQAQVYESELRRFEELQRVYEIGKPKWRRRALRMAVIDDRILERLINLYHFARGFQAVEFANIVMSQSQYHMRSMLADKNFMSMPSYKIVHYAVNKLGMTTKLCKYLAAVYGIYAPLKAIVEEHEDFEELPPAFLVEVLVRTPRYNSANPRHDHPNPLNKDHFCFWHSHEDDEDSNSCKESREIPNGGYQHRIETSAEPEAPLRHPFRTPAPRESFGSIPISVITPSRRHHNHYISSNCFPLADISDSEDDL